LFTPVEAGNADVTAGVKTVDGRTYLVVVSGAREPVAVALKVTGRTARVLFDRPQDVALADGRLSVDLGAYATRLYELLP
jgi:hypothetical protein